MKDHSLGKPVNIPETGERAGPQIHPLAVSCTGGGLTSPAQIKEEVQSAGDPSSATEAAIRRNACS